MESIIWHGQFSGSSNEARESVDFLYTLDNQPITGLSWLLISEVSGHDRPHCKTAHHGKGWLQSKSSDLCQEMKEGEIPGSLDPFEGSPRVSLGLATKLGHLVSTIP